MEPIMEETLDVSMDQVRWSQPKKKKEKRKDNIRSLRFHFHEKSTPFSVCPCRDQRVEKLVRIPRFVRLITWPRGSTILFMRL